MRRASGRKSTGLEPRWYDRIRQSMADRRRGGRFPRTVRRVLAVVLIICAGVIALAPPRATPGHPVVSLTRDLPIGTTLTPDDVQLGRAEQVPDGALTDPALVVGRVLAGQARRGEVVTDVRLAEPSGPDPGPGRVAVPVRPADPAIADLLDPGMHVAVLLVGEAGEPTILAADAIVLVIPERPERGDAERPIVLAVPAESADRLVAAALAGTIGLRFT